MTRLSGVEQTNICSRHLQMVLRRRTSTRPVVSELGFQSLAVLGVRLALELSAVWYSCFLISALT
jgi:hypothetical protein